MRRVQQLHTKKTEERVAELEAQGVKAKLVTIGKKGTTYFKRRPQYDLVKSFAMGQAPKTEEAQAIADEVYPSSSARRLTRLSPCTRASCP